MSYRESRIAVKDVCIEEVESLDRMKTLLQKKYRYEEVFKG